MNKSVGNMAQQAEGMMKWQVINPDGSVAREAKAWQKNLILNVGMNEVAARAWCNCFTHAIASTGTTPTLVSGGASTVQQTGQTVTIASGAFVFSGSDVGNTIKFTSGGADALIVTFVSPTNVTVDIAQTVSPVTFNVYQTNQTISSFNGANEERTITYVTGAGNCGTVIFGGTVFQNRRTYDFAIRGSDKTYRELGFGWSITVGAATVFSRMLIQGGSVLVQTGQRLRVTYQLNLTAGPQTSISLPTNIIGWPHGSAGPATAVEQIQEIGLTGVNVSGGTTNLTTEAVNEPFTGPRMSWGTTGGAPSAAFSVPSARTFIENTTIGAISPAYVTNTFYTIRRFVYDTGQIVSTLLRCFVLGGVGTTSYGYIIVWDNAQEKPNTHTLTMNIRIRWSRVLQ